MRYFYRDPLAAAWQAKHFGMRFYNGTQQGDSYWVQEEIFPNLLEEGDGFYPIHPDSLHLLEPEPQDGIVTPLGLSNVKEIIGDGLIESSDGPDWLRGEYQIIQRNGIAFHWPEQEG